MVPFLAQGNRETGNGVVVPATGMCLFGRTTDRHKIIAPASKNSEDEMKLEAVFVLLLLLTLRN